MKKKIIGFLVLIMLLSINLYFTNALYKTIQMGQASLSVATPKIKILSEATNIEELDQNVYTNEFKVVNYDEQGISEVGMTYNLFFNLTDGDAPIDIKLYKIEDNGIETEIILNDSLECDTTFNFTADSKQEHSYKLKLWFNLETGYMDDNVELNINLKSIQTKPN